MGNPSAENSNKECLENRSSTSQDHKLTHDDCSMNIKRQTCITNRFTIEDDSLNNFYIEDKFESILKNLEKSMERTQMSYQLLQKKDSQCMPPSLIDHFHIEDLNNSSIYNHNEASAVKKPISNNIVTPLLLQKSSYETHFDCNAKTQRHCNQVMNKIEDSSTDNYHIQERLNSIQKNQDKIMKKAQIDSHLQKKGPPLTNVKDLMIGRRKYLTLASEDSKKRLEMIKKAHNSSSLTVQGEKKIIAKINSNELSKEKKHIPVSNLQKKSYKTPDTMRKKHDTLMQISQISSQQLQEKKGSALLNVKDLMIGRRKYLTLASEDSKKRLEMIKKARNYSSFAAQGEKKRVAKINFNELSKEKKPIPVSNLQKKSFK